MIYTQKRRSLKDRAAGIARRFRHITDHRDLEARLQYAAHWARQTFDPSRGMTYDEYEDLCLQNCASHIWRQLVAEARRRGVTDSTDKPSFGDGLHLGDLLCDSRNSGKRMMQVIQLREYIAAQSGDAWAACVAWLAGYCKSEIARHLGYARSTFDRLFGEVLAGLWEAAR